MQDIKNKKKRKINSNVYIVCFLGIWLFWHLDFKTFRL